MNPQMPMDKNAVRKYKLGEEPSDFEYWQTKSPGQRLQALEEIRKEYNNGSIERFQRVYRIVKRS